MGEIGQVQCCAILAFHLSRFVVEFLRELFQHTCPSPDEEGDTGSSLLPVCSVHVLTHCSCVCGYAGCSTFHTMFPNAKEGE